MRSDLVKAGSPAITVFGGIKGLKRDGDLLKETFSEVKPDAILITISPEEVEGIIDFVKEPFRMTLSDYEMIYGVNLRQYGEVQTPSPIYVDSAEISLKYHVPLIGLDMPEEKFSHTYSQTVSTWELIRHSVRKRRLLRSRFKDDTPEKFVESWNKTVNSIRGFRKMELLRMQEIISGIDRILGEAAYNTFLLVAEYEFYPDIVKHLESIGYGKNSE